MFTKLHTPFSTTKLFYFLIALASSELHKQLLDIPLGSWASRCIFSKCCFEQQHPNIDNHVIAQWLKKMHQQSMSPTGSGCNPATQINHRGQLTKPLSYFLHSSLSHSPTHCNQARLSPSPSQQLSHSYSTSQLIHTFSQLNLPPSHRARACMHACTHTHTHTRTHARTHTHVD